MTIDKTKQDNKRTCQYCGLKFNGPPYSRESRSEVRDSCRRTSCMSACDVDIEYCIEAEDWEDGK